MTNIQAIPDNEILQNAVKDLQLRFPVKEISEKTGFNKGTISSYISGKIPPSLPFLESFSKEFKINLADYKDIENEPEKNVTGYYYPDVMAAAGIDKEVLNNELNKIPINIPNWGKDLDFINVFGDSMFPKFNSGEIIGIKEVEFAYLIYGFAYVVVLNNGDVYVKYIKKGSDKNHIVLESENKFYEPKEFHLSQIKRIYQVKGVISKITM